MPPLARPVCGHGSRTRSGEKPRPQWPPHPLPALRLVTTQKRPLVLHLRALMEHLRHWRRVPILSSSVEGNAMLILQPLVAAFAVVRGVMVFPTEADRVGLESETVRHMSETSISPLLLIERSHHICLRSRTVFMATTHSSKLHTSR